MGSRRTHPDATGTEWRGCRRRGCRADRRSGQSHRGSDWEIERDKGKTVIDATNRFGVEPPAGFKSNAEFVKSKTNGPTAKAFNINFASVYGRLKAAHSRPSNIWCGDDSARAVVEQLSRDAGYDPVSAGPITNASEQENLIKIIFAINQSGFGPFVYRIAHPEDL